MEKNLSLEYFKYLPKKKKRKRGDQYIKDPFCSHISLPVWIMPY